MAPIKFNPLIFSGFDLTGGSSGPIYWASPVSTENDLPVPASQDGEARVVQDTDKIYIWDATSSKWIDTGITLASFGGTSAEGLTTSTTTTGDITRRTLQLNEASSTTPGAVSIGSQNFAGEKTFDDLTTASSGVETDSIDSITSGSGTLSIGGSNASTINIGDSGVNVNLYGNTFYQDVTNLQVTDKQITLNKDGAIASAFNSGIELEENGSITGYVSTSGDRNSWELKPPGVAGIATISPGVSGITLDQSSHDPVTLGAVGASPNADGATLTNQVLNLEPADSTNPGVITAGTQTIGGAKTLVDELTASGGIFYSPTTPADWNTPAPAQVAPALDELAERFTNQNDVTNEPTGFPNRTDSTVSFDDSTYTLTIAPTIIGGSYDVYIKGKKYTKTTESIQISTPLVGGDYYFYFNSTGVLSVSNVFSPEIISQYAFISIVYWNPDVLPAPGVHTYFAEERHGLTMDGVTHSYLHTVFGARYLSGLALQGFTIATGPGAGNSNSHAQFTSDQGRIRDEDILLTILSQAQIPILYRQGQLWRKKVADSFPVIYAGTAGYGVLGVNRLPYNQYTGGAWQLTEVQTNKFVLVHFFATNDKENGVVGIQGIAQYDSIEAARTAANNEITSLSGLPFAEFVPIGTVLFETSTGYTNTPKARVVAVDGADYVDFRGTQLYTPAGEATTHSLLSGLGNDDHFQYLLVDGTRAMSGDLDLGNFKIENLADGTALTDAVTVNQITKTATTFAGFDNTGLLNPVPGWSFDDSGAAQVGAQNSLIVPPSVTDFSALTLTPAVQNTGLLNFSLININPSVDQPVSNLTMVQTNGYGTDAPVDYFGFVSSPNFSASSTSYTHFSATTNSQADSIIGYNYSITSNPDFENPVNIISSGNNTSGFRGVTVDKSGDSGAEMTGFYVSTTSTSGNVVGFQLDALGITCDNAVGFKVDFSSTTPTASRAIGLEITDASIQQTHTFETASNNPNLVDSGNVLRNTFQVQSGSPITGTDVILNNAAGFIQLNDDHSGSALGLGISSVGFISQIAGSGTATADSVNLSLAGLAIDSTSTGGTVTETSLYKGLILDFGGTINLTNVYGLRIDDGNNTLSSNATNAWGISVEDTGAENYLAKSLVIGGLTKVASNADVALEIQEPKTLVLGNATTAEKAAIANVSGALIYDTDLNRPYYNDGGAWNRLGLSPGDIDQTPFTALDNVIIASDITGLAFSNLVTRGFEVQVSIQRGSTNAEYTLKGIQKTASWEMSQDYIGDETGIAFSITAAGQIRYTSTNTGTNANLIFRAQTV